MLELADKANRVGVRFRGLYHPDNWVWVDDGDNLPRVVFINALANTRVGQYDWVDS